MALSMKSIINKVKLPPICFKLFQRIEKEENFLDSELYEIGTTLILKPVMNIKRRITGLFNHDRWKRFLKISNSATHKKESISLRDKAYFWNEKVI